MNEVPKVRELLYPALEAFKALGGSATMNEIHKFIAGSGQYSEEILAVPHNARNTKIRYRLAWVGTYLRHLGAIEQSERGVWFITNIGLSFTENEVQERQKAWIKEWHANKKAKSLREAEEDSKVSADEDEENSSDESEWKDELLNIIKDIDPAQFERLTQRVLRESGFSEVNVTGRPSDGGIDGTGVLEVNLISFPVVFQCKRYQGSVTPSAVRDFRGSLPANITKGLFVTTGTFTNGAQKEAMRSDAASTIDLIDGDRFCDLLKQYNLGVSTKMVEEVKITKKFFDDF